MAKAKQNTTANIHTKTFKRSSQGGRKPKTSSMNKHARRGFKKNRGQGR